MALIVSMLSLIAATSTAPRYWPARKEPFPWIIADFGLLDAIESGLVKIPQLPARDVSGAEEAAYFNIWRWVQAKAKEDGYGINVTPQIVMNYASAPINLLATEWHQRFIEWEQFSKQQQRHPVPPVFGGVPTPMTIAEFSKLIAVDTEKWAMVIRAANIKPE